MAMELKINKKTLIIIGGLILLGIVIGVTVFLLTKGDDSSLPDDGIEIPLNYSETRNVEIPSDTTLENKTSESYVYKISLEGRENLIFDLVENSNVSHYSYRVSETLYQWGGADTTYVDLITYDSTSQYVNFNTETPVSVSGVSRPIDNEDEAYELAVSIAQEILGDSTDYALVNVEVEDGNYVVNFSRLVSDLKVEAPMLGDYSDTLTLNEDGQIVFGKILLANYYDSVAVDIVNFNQIGNYLSSENYPYTFIPGAPIGYLDSLVEPEGDFYEVPADSEPLGGDITSCTAQSAELVYYYQSTYQTYLVPTYRIDCLGSTTIDGLKFDVPVLVYTNAINPELVYVPAE